MNTTKKRKPFSNEMYQPKEKVGVGRVYEPTGETIEKGINAQWGGYTFTPEEVDALFEGKEIKVVTSNDKVVIGYLGKGEYKGVTYWGFMRGIPQKTAGHEWTEDERKRLYAGEDIKCDDFYSPKKCEHFTAYAFWDEVEHEIELFAGYEEDEE